MLSRQERVALFKSLFKGREDVFARRWEKWNGGAKKVYDYRDENVPILEKLWRKRATYYRKNGFEIS